MKEAENEGKLQSLQNKIKVTKYPKLERLWVELHNP